MPKRKAAVSRVQKRQRFMSKNKLDGRALANLRTGGFLQRDLKGEDYQKDATALTAPTDCSGGEHDPTSALSITAVGPGDAHDERIGTRILVKSLHVNGVIRCAAQANLTALTEPPIIYIAMVLDKQTNGAQLSSEDVFDNLAGNAYTAASPMRKLETTSRFQVLRSLQFKLPQPAVAYDGTNMEQMGVSVPWRMDLKRDIPVQFSGQTAAISSVSDNSVHIIAFCSSTDWAPTIAYNARCRYLD